MMTSTTKTTGVVRRTAVLALAVLSLVTLGLSTASCGSTAGGKRTGPIPAMRVTMRDFRNGLTFVILNDAWLVKRGIEGDTVKERRLNFQSQSRSMEDSTAKVFEDAVVDAYIHHIETTLELHPLMLDGPIGTTSPIYSSAIEIVEGTNVRHVGGGAGYQSTIEEKRNYWSARKAFTEIYNAQYSLQATEDPFATGGRP